MSESVVHQGKADEWERKLAAEYKRGRHDERRIWEDKKRKQRPGGPRLGRPPKYDFATLKIGDKLETTEPNTKLVYALSRQWAQRNAPSRRFRIRPTETGSTVARTA